jgi:hypothetical protein
MPLRMDDNPPSIPSSKATAMHTGRPPCFVPARLWACLFLLFLLPLAAGCGDRTAEELARRTETVGRQLASLKESLENGDLRNALILKTYTERLGRDKPDAKTLAEEFAKDAGAEGPLYQGLAARAEALPSIADKKEALSEAAALEEATRKEVYDAALLDVVNTVADLSGGTLPRIQAPPDASPGDGQRASALVGNPNYGQWQTGSGGNFWMWYGAYRMIGDLVGGGSPVEFSSWNRRRPWSYYQDHGRDYFSSPSQRAADLRTAPRGRFSSSYGGTSRKNPYFAPAAPLSAKKSPPGRFRSSYGGSLRRGTRSFGRFGGK